MADANSEGLTIGAQRSGQRVILSVNLNGETIHTDVLNPCAAKARDAFLARLIELAPGLDGQREAAEAELIKIAERHAAALAAEQAGRSDRATAPAGLPEHEPWPEEVDGAELLDELINAIRKFVVLGEAEAATCALWILFAATHDAFDVSPMLSIASPAKGCGKSTLLGVVAGVVPRPLATSGISAAALYRSIATFNPTILADEVDALLKPGNPPEDLRATFNSGWSRTSAFILRCVGDEHEPRPFPTWAPKLLAGIGRRPATIEDRSITINLRRRGPGEKCSKFRRKAAGPILTRLGGRVARWATDNLDELRGVSADVPELGRDRLEDNWEPLLIVADRCGCDWPARARAAARTLAAAVADEEDAAILLLEDLRVLFDETGTDRLATQAVLDRLLILDGRPWGEWRKGRPITFHGLSRLLRPFGVASRNIKIEGGRVVKGYLRSDLQDPWDRYLAHPPLSKRNAATEADNLENPGFQTATTDEPVADRKDEKPNGNEGCSTVADQKGGDGGNGKSGQANLFGVPAAIPRQKRIQVIDRTCDADPDSGRRKVPL